MKKFFIVSMITNVVIAISVVLLTVAVLSGGELSISNGGTQRQEAATAKKPAATKDAISKKYDNGMTLDKALKKGKPVAVLFYADWCGFCKRFSPLYAELSKDSELKSKFTFAYVNSEDAKNRAFFQEYQVKGFPTLYLVNEKGEKAQVPNNLMFQENSKEILKEKFNAFLTDGPSAIQQPFRAEEKAAD